MTEADAIEIRAFEWSHAGELLALWRESFEWGVGIVDPHPLAEQEQYLRTVVAPHNAIRVAFLGERMAGFVAASPASIAQLYVRKDLCRRGIGSALLAWAKAQSGGSLSLFTFERNAVARAFYERHGFTIVARGYEPTWMLNDLKYAWRAASTFKYFAYGSNMCKRWLAARAPSAMALVTGFIEGRRLAFDKVSRDGSGKCDLERTEVETDRVFGVVYEIALAEKAGLDEAEGLGRGYDVETVTVHTNAGDLRALTYFATAKDRGLRPYRWYQELVVAGAVEHALPKEYVDAIRAVEAIDDPDAARRARNKALLA